jgi:EmrB/QacA subfamily drug resistance transporter
MSTAVAAKRPQVARSGSTMLLILICLAQFMVILDVSIVNIALPSIKDGLHFSTSGLQWVINAYTITFGGFLLLGGRAADLLGRRRVFLGGTAMFGFASLLCAFTSSRGLLIGARALQGLGGAALSPASLAIVTTSFAEGAERNRALGIWGALGGLGGASGAVLGGLLTQGFGWPAIFLINVPIAVGVVLVGRGLIPESRREGATRHFDLSGAILVTAGLTVAVYGIVQSETLGWGSAGVIGPLLLAVALLAGFTLVEGKLAAAPLLPLGVLRMKRLRGANIVVTLLYGGVFAMWFFLTLYLQEVLGFTPLEAGFSFLPMTLGVAAAATLAPRLVAAVGVRVVITIGMFGSAAGLTLLSMLPTHGSYLSSVLPGGLISAVGFGFALVPSTIAAVQGVPTHQAGLASGLLNTARLGGGALGLAVLSTIADSHTASEIARGVSSHAAMTSGYRLAFAIGAGLCLAGGLAAIRTLGAKDAGRTSLARRWSSSEARAATDEVE